MNNNKKYDYASPEIQTLEMQVESTILTGSDPTITNPDMGWDD